MGLLPPYQKIYIYGLFYCVVLLGFMHLFQNLVKILIKKIRLSWFTDLTLQNWRMVRGSQLARLWQKQRLSCTRHLESSVFKIFNFNINSNCVYLDFGPPSLILLAQSSHYTAHTFGILLCGGYTMGCHCMTASWSGTSGPFIYF